MALPRCPFIAWREQPDGSLHPRFQPGPRERALGFAGTDLKHESGAWFSLDEARAYAVARHAEIVAVRAGGRRLKAPPAAARGKTLEDLLADWLAADPATSDRTRAGYRKQVSAIIYRPQSAQDRVAKKPKELEPFARTPVSAIGKPEMTAFFDYQRRTRGLHMARASRAVISAALTWGESSTRWRLQRNPLLGLKFEKPPGRIVIYTRAEFAALVAAADALPACTLDDGTLLTRASIGDSALLGVFTGQRLSDRLALEDIGLVDGRRQFRQRKTNVVVAIPETPELKARLEAARVRVARIALKYGTRPTTIVVDETTGRAYHPDTYRHVFADVRALALQGSNEHALPPCPSLQVARADGSTTLKRDQDFRDTAVTWLARAGATLPEIAAITGHSLRSIHEIMQHYLAITPELADSGIRKLVAWMDKEGATG